MQKKMIFTNVLIAAFSFLVISMLNEERLQASSVPNSLHLDKLPYTFDFDGPTCSKPSLVFDGPFPKVPKAMMVYKVKHPNITEASVRKLGQKFGIPADAKLKRTSRLRLKTTTQYFEVNPTNGTFSLEKIRKYNSQTGTKKKYPAKKECENISRTYLKAHNLFSKDAYFRGIADNTLSLGVMSVAFGRKIGRYKTIGAGARIYVGIGPDGEVFDVRKAWQQLVPYKPYPIISPQKALEELEKGKGVLDGCEGKIKKITFRYYTSPEKQDYVQPIYYFDCNGPEGDFSGSVPAIKNEYIQSREEYWKEIEDKAASSSK
ncbi:MAG: hypothetical protein ACYS91_20290 [Planctomycetota bacterium]|jgi:hypothetical protein